MKNILAIIGFIYSFAIFSSGLFAANYGSVSTERIYNLGIAVFPGSDFQSINTNYYSKEVVSKYHNTGFTITCILPNSPAEKSGLKIYDHIVGVDEDKTYYLAFADDQEIILKIQKNGKIISKKIKPKKNEIAAKEMVKYSCSNEHKQLECGSFFRDKSISEIVQNKKIFECFYNSNSSVIPFAKEESWLMLESFNWMFSDYLWKARSPAKLNEYIPVARNYIEFVGNYIKENKLTEKKKLDLEKTLISIEREMLNAYKFVENKNLKKANDKINIAGSDIENIKNKILIINQNQLILKKNDLDYFKNVYDVLKKKKEFAFIQREWEKAIKKIDWKNEQNLKYFSIYKDYADSFYHYDFVKSYEIFNSIDKILSENFPKNLDALILIGDIQAQAFFAMTSAILTGKKKNSDIVKPVEKLKETLSIYEYKNEEDKKYLLNDRNFLHNIYLALSISIQFPSSNNLQDVDHNASIKYSILAINEIDRNRKFETKDTKLGFYQIIISAYIAKGNMTKVLDYYYRYKNLVSVVVNNKQGLSTITNSAPYLSFQLYNLGLYEESEELADLLINYTKPGDLLEDIEWMGAVENSMRSIVKGSLLMKKNNYKEAISLFEKSYKRCEINSKDPSVLYNCMVYMRLLEAVYANGETEKFEKLYIEKLLVHPKQDDLTSIKKFALNVSPDLSAGVFLSLLDYHKKNNSKKNYDQLAELTDKYTEYALKYIGNQAVRGVTSEFDVYVGLANIAKHLSENKNSFGKEIFRKIAPKIEKYYQSEIFQSSISSNFKSQTLLDSYFSSALNTNDTYYTQGSYMFAQTIKNSIVEKEVQRGVVKRELVSNTARKLIKEYQEAQISLTSFYKNEDFLITKLASKGFENKANLKSFETVDKIREKINLLEKKINEQYPEYYQAIKPQSLSVTKIQSFLNKDEAIFEYFFTNKKTYIAAIKKDNFKLFEIDLSLKKALNLENNIRASLTVDSSGNLSKFDTKSAHELYKIIFKPTEEFVANIKHLFIIPDGPIRSIPLHLLATKDAPNCTDCQNVEWLMNKYKFSYLPSVNFIKNNPIERQPDFISQLFDKATSTLKSQLKNNDIKRKYIYLGIGDPVFEKKLAKKNNASTKHDKLAFLFQRGGVIANTDEIKNIYSEVAGSNEEIKAVENFFTKEKSTLLLRKKASETILKKLNLLDYKVIHFATHGEMSGAIKGYNEPFLVMSPPDFGTEEDDGILTMSEIMLLDNNADLIILSACNTAMGENSESEGFSGLAKAFLYSGAKSIFVSNWAVETYAAKELTVKMVSKMILKKEDSSQALNDTMKEFIQENPKKNHPFYWAPFVMVGQNVNL